MQASDRVFILAQFEPESAGNNFLKHRKGEHVMRQPEERVVGSHACKHTEPPPSHHELERTGAWDFLVVFFDVCSVEELDNCPAGVGATFKQSDDILHLINATHLEQARTICPIERSPVV